MSEQVKIVITTGQPQARITGKGSVSKLEKPKPGGSGWQQKQTKPWKPTRKPTFARDGHFDPTGIPSPPTNIPGPFSGKFAPPSDLMIFPAIQCKPLTFSANLPICLYERRECYA